MCSVYVFVSFFPSFKNPTLKGFPRIFFQQSNASIHSLKLTWHLKIDPWKRRFLLEATIFRCQLLVSGSVIHISVLHLGDFQLQKKILKYSKDAMESLNKTPQPSWNPSITFDLWKLKKKTPTWKGSNRCFTQPQLPW